MKKFLLFIVISTFAFSGFSQNHFEVAYTQQPQTWMSVYIFEASISGINLTTDDEIAVFDGDICCGLTKLDGDFSGPDAIPAAKAEGAGTGYTEGNDILVKIWDASEEIEYDATVEFKSDSPYEVFVDNESAYLNVSAKIALTLQLTAGDKEYDGSDDADVGYSLQEGTLPDDLTVNVTGGQFNNKNAGTNKTVTGSIQVTGPVENYDITRSESTTATITKKPVTVINAAAQNKNYDGTTEATIAGATLSGVISPDEVQITNATTGTFAQAGTGSSLPVTTSMGLTGAGAGNYQLTGQPSGLAADITKAPLTVTADNKEKTYDGEAFSGFTASYNGFVPGEGPDDLDGTLGFATNPEGALVNAGTWEIIPSGLSSENYDITFVYGELNILKATITVTADDKSKVYGDANPPLTFQYSGFVAGQDESVLDTEPTASTTVDENSDAGVYTDAITVSGGSDHNYSFNYTHGDLIVTKANAEVFLSALNQFYNGQPRHVSVTTTPDSLLVDITYNGLTETPIEIGEYTVVATVNDENYEGSAEGTLRILESDSPQIDDFGLKPLSIVCGSDYQEQLQLWLEENAGAVASDESGIKAWSYDFDPNILSEICGIQDTSIVVTFTVEDMAGNTATISSMLHVKINEGPFLVNPIPDYVINASDSMAIPFDYSSGVIFDDVNDTELELGINLENSDTLPHWVEILNDSLFFAPMIADTGCINVIVTATDSFGASASDTFQVCVEGYPVDAGKIGNLNPEVTFYPNPTQGEVNIDFNITDIREVQLTVFNISGQRVLERQYYAGERITFDMSGNVSGIYLVKINFGDMQVLKKLILDKK